MKKLFFCYFIFLVAYDLPAQNQDRAIDSTVYLALGGEKIECVKRYFKYEVSPINRKDTTVFDSPKFFTYLHKGYKIRNIGTTEHMEYRILVDLETGEETWYKEETDSTTITKHFGTASKDWLFVLLSAPKVFFDTRDQYPIAENFSVEISSEDRYLKLCGAMIDFKDILKLELSELKSGDTVILKDLNFKSPLLSRRTFLGPGYWIIE